ncbi:hypothetical protein BJY04DRAFT_221946 [Aspergillus karnatakaensis]|uniref:uncharacterized protein n=1 Tax=Aspergillus karnatakaensis TaxID=1810916 RepID=UPI003CCDC11F
MVPAFGFSTGDFIAVAALIWSLSQALSETSEDSKLIREVQLEISAFQDIVVQLEKVMTNGAVPSANQVARTRNVLSQMERLINEFNQHTEKYASSKPSDTNKDGTRRIVSLKKKLGWSLFGKKQVSEFRDAIKGYAVVLGLIMQALNSQAMQGLQKQMETGTQGLELQVRTGTEVIKAHIDTVIQEPWDQKPIRFQDASDRGLNSGFIDFLRHAFKNSPILAAVERQSIWLFSPVKGKPKVWNLISNKAWSSAVYPGVQLSMSISTGKHVQEEPSTVEKDSGLKLQTPLPLWASASYPEDAQFQLS